MAATTATMDFFAHQDRARRMTGLLVFYYACAVVAIVAAVYFVLLGSLQVAAEGETTPAATAWNPDLFLYVAGGVLAVIAIGTVYKIVQLHQGGAAVARMLGGRRVAPNSTDTAERRLLNVVEEMAIAAGTPVPEVYVLDEELGINAFAAGFSTRDAIVAVTRGTLERLNRDELQGVIAHEFSHILNGDMGLNLKLTGVLHGILLIALIGYTMMRVLRHSGRSRSKRGDVTLGIAMLGLALWVIGYIGVFFGKLIKSAVSRQREFLADASAVQFTRNPEGIGGALKKIGQVAAGSRIGSEHAEEASHFFFANGLRSAWFGLFATHPPLDERIRRITAEAIQTVPAATPVGAVDGAVSGFAAAAPTPAPSMQRPALVESAGTLSAEAIAGAGQLIAAIPADLQAACRTPLGARAVVYALLISTDETVRDAQRTRLAEGPDASPYPVLQAALPLTATLPAECRMPLAALCVPALRQLSAEAYRAFTADLDHLVAADAQLDLFEYALQRMIRRHVAVAFEKRPFVPGPQASPAQLKAYAASLLSCLAYWGADDAKAARVAFESGLRALGHIQPMRALEDCGLGLLDESLKGLESAPARVRQNVLTACVACITTDEVVTVEEAELLRAVADALGCPIPPLAPGRLAAA